MAVNSEARTIGKDALVNRPRATLAIVNMQPSDDAITALHRQLIKASLGPDRGTTAYANCLSALVLMLEPTLEIGDLIDAIPRRKAIFTELDVTNALANIGYSASGQSLRLRDIDARLLPCLFLPDATPYGSTGRAIVLRAIEKTENTKSYIVFDGNSGETRVLPNDHPDITNVGMAYFFKKIQKIADSSTSDGAADAETSWFNQTLSRFHGLFILLLVVSLLLSLVALATPVFIILTYDRVIATGLVGALPLLLIGALGGIGMEMMLREIRTRVLSWLSARLDYTVGASIFSRLIHLPPSYVEHAAVSSQLARIKTFESVRDFFSGPLFQSVLEIPAIMISFAAIIFLSGWLAAVPAIAVLTYIMLFFTVRAAIKPVLRKAAQETSKAQAFAIETFQKLEAIRVNGLAEIWAEKFRELSGRDNATQARLNFLGSVGETLGHSLALLSAAATLVFGVHLIWAGSLTPGVLIASMLLVWRIINPFYSLCCMIPRVEQIRGSIGQIDHLMQLKTEEDGIGVQTRLSRIKGDVAFTGVALRYTREAVPVLVGMTASFKAGEIVAITGSNGTGKSSLLKLIMGLYAPQIGTIRIDGYDIRQVTCRDLRRSIGYIPQVPLLLKGSIAENLRSVRPMASDAALYNALAKAGADKIVTALPHGLETDIDDKAVWNAGKLLVHQIAFARVFLQNSNLVLIDEQPSALLNAGLSIALERLIAEARGKKSVFFISHHTAHLRFADKVIALRYGKPPLVGTVGEQTAESKEIAA